MVIPMELLAPVDGGGVFHHSGLKTSTVYDTAPCYPSSGFLSMNLSKAFSSPCAYTGETTLRLVVPLSLGARIELRSL